MIALAELEASYRPGPAAQQALDIANAEAGHLIAMAEIRTSRPESPARIPVPAPSAPPAEALCPPALEARTTAMSDAEAQPPVADRVSSAADETVTSTTGSERTNAGNDSFFDFGKSDLRQAGRATLDEFARTLDKALDKTSKTSIRVVGHTDRIGSDAVNQQLSEQRAESVKTYLVSKSVDASRLQTEGRGASGPVTRTSECTSETGPALITCL